MKNLSIACRFSLWKTNHYKLSSNCFILNFQLVFIFSLVNAVIIIILEIVLGLKKIFRERQ